MEHPDLPATDTGDANVERLLRHAPAEPPVPSPAFARSLVDSMKAAAAERAAEQDAEQAAGATAPTAPPLSPLAGLGIVTITAAAVAAIVWFGQLGLASLDQPAPNAVPQADAPEPPRAPTAVPTEDPAAPPQSLADALPGLSPRPRVPMPAPETVLAPATLSTATGEQRAVTLEDGSVLYLDSSTTAHIQPGRSVVLERGRLYVEVAPAPSASEPFELRIADHRVEALGTRIGATLDPATLHGEVLVTQGRVRLQTATGAQEILDAGQQVSLDPGAVRSPSPEPAPPLADSLAWMRPLLEAAETPLVPRRSAEEGGAIVVTDERGEESRLELRRQHVDVHIEDGFARTTVVQTYFNHTGQQLEGTFRFPLPADASISRLAMYVDGALMEGGMVERDRGRTVFETIRHQRRDPALLEWVDGNVFKMRVFPLLPRQEKVILISYTQKLPLAGGEERYVFPVGHSHDGKLREWSLSARLVGAANRAWSCGGLQAATYCEGADRILARAGARAPSGDVEILVHTQRSASGSAPHVSLSAHEGERYLMVRAPVELALPPHKTARHWVIVFESSSSRDPVLARVQCDVARAILENAEHTDTFCLVTAASRVRSFRELPLPATRANVQAALAFLDRAHLLGGLDLGAAFANAAGLVAQAPAGKQPTIVHLGGGIATLGETAPDRLAALIPDSAEYVGVAVGKSWSRPLMQAAARRTGGFTRQLDPASASRWSALEVVSQLESPRLSWIQVTGRAADGSASGTADGAAEPLTLLPLETTVFPGGEVLAAARLPQGAPLPAGLAVTGFVGHTPFELTVPVPAGLADDGTAGFLPRTWARLEIERLVEADREGNRERIVALSKAMYVLSPFTSLLVLENEAMYEQYGVDRGRKDHWALFPAPARIPVVHEPVLRQGTAPAGGSAETEGTGEPAGPTERERIQKALGSLAWSRRGIGPQTVPAFERYYANGLGTVRGFDYRGIGLRDFPGASIQLVEAGWDRWYRQGQRGGEDPWLAVEQAFVDWDSPMEPLRMRAGISDMEYDLRGAGNAFFLDLSESEGVGHSLESLGVDWRGLGDRGRLPVAGLDGISVPGGFDEFLVGMPAEVGGLFFDDGRDGDYRARVENIFDEALGDLGGITGSPGIFVHRLAFNLGEGGFEDSLELDWSDTDTIDLAWPWAMQQFGESDIAVGWNGEVFAMPIIDSTARGGRGPWHTIDRLFRATTARAAEPDPSSMRDEVLRQERHQARVRARRIRELFGQGIEAFDRRSFADSEAAAREILRLDPGDRHAQRLRDQSVMLRHRKREESLVADKVDRWREFLRDMQEAKIPWQETIVWPDEDAWLEEIAGRDGQRAAAPRAPAVQFEARPAFLDAGSSPAARTFASRLASTRITLEFEEQPLPEVLAFISDIADVPLVCYLAVAEELAPQAILVTLALEDTPLSEALATLCETYGLTASFTDDAVVVSRAHWKRPEAWALLAPGALVYRAPATAATQPESWFYADLAAHLPGLANSRADALAAIDAELPELAARGTIDDRARALVEGARSAGWRSVSLGGATLVFDGRGRYSLTRTVGVGFAEHVVCDGERLLHLYPELGLGARRELTRHHRAALRRLVPWLLPPVEDLTTGADVSAVADRVVAVTPLDHDAPTRMELSFAPDGQLVERRLVLRESGEAVRTETYGAGGAVRITGAGDELIAEGTAQTEPAAAPDLQPDLQGLLVLPLPLHTMQTMLQTVRSNALAELPPDDALAFLGACWAAKDTWYARQLVTAQGWNTDVEHPGLRVLLAGFARRLEHEFFPVQLPPLPDSPAATYVDTLFGAASRDRLPARSTLRRLADMRSTLRALAGITTGGDSAGGLSAAGVLALLRSCSPDLATQLLAAVVEQGSAELTAGLAQDAELIRERCGDGYDARYQIAALLAAAGLQEQAAAAFESLHAQASELMATPPIDAAFRLTLESAGRWHSLMAQRAADLIGVRQPEGVLDLALQARRLEDPDLASELVALVLADVSGEEIGPRLCRSLLVYGLLAEDWHLALAQLERLLTHLDSGVWPGALTLAATVAGNAGEHERRAHFLEAALQLEFGTEGDELEVAWVRNRFGALLRAYEDLARSDAAPADLPARVVLTADRWIQLDPEPTAASLQAALVLDLLGEPELARDYETAAIDLSPSDSAPWVALGHSLQARNHHERAAQAFAQAFTLEPTNPQHLMDQAACLTTLGRLAEARALHQRVADGVWQPRFQNLQRQSRGY